MTTSIDSLTLCLAKALNVANKDSCNAFVNTFSAVEMSFYCKQGLNLEINPSSKQSGHAEAKKVQASITKTQVESAKDEGRIKGKADEENQKLDDSPTKHGSSLLTKITDYINELPFGHEVARAYEFATQTEEVFANLYGFKYMLNAKILKNTDKFNEILRF